MTPKLSIILVNYRSADVLADCLRSLHVATKEHLEVIVVDNSPDDGARDVLRTSGWSGHYYLQAENIGYTRAANLGAAHATGDYLCFLNPDTVLEAHALDRLLAWVFQHSRTVAGPRERDPQGHITTSAFPFVTRRYLWGANLLLKFPWPRSWHPWLPWLVPSYHYAARCRTATSPTVVPVLSGSCLVMSHQLWREVGPWQEALTYFGLESEWFHRARRLGVTAWYVPDAVIFHEHAVSIRRGRRAPVRAEANRNRRWHARRLGWLALAILLAVLWFEGRLKPSSD